MKKSCFVLWGVLFSLFCSCSTGEAASIAANLFRDNSQAPVFLDCKAVSETEIEFKFSRPVKVNSLQFSPSQEIALIEEGSTVRATLDKSPGQGVRLVADLLAEDERGNTTNVLVPFRSRNSRVPQLIINELRTEYSKPRAEFIEFIAKSDGNLAALRVFAASNNKNPMIYEFLPVEVKRGEYIVLHLRTLDEAANRNEYGTRLDESGGTDSSPTARDIWIPGSVKLLRKTDAVYVLDQDDHVLDAVMISETPDQKWQKDYLAEAAEFLFSKGAWESPDGDICIPANAVDSSSIKTAATKSISREEKPDTNTQADWYITATGGATPGMPNNPKR